MIESLAGRSPCDSQCSLFSGPSSDHSRQKAMIVLPGE